MGRCRASAAPGRENNTCAALPHPRITVTCADASAPPLVYKRRVAAAQLPSSPPSHLVPFTFSPHERSTSVEGSSPTPACHGPRARLLPLPSALFLTLLRIMLGMLPPLRASLLRVLTGAQPQPANGDLEQAIRASRASSLPSTRSHYAQRLSRSPTDAARPRRRTTRRRRPCLLPAFRAWPTFCARRARSTARSTRPRRARCSSPRPP